MADADLNPGNSRFLAQSYQNPCMVMQQHQYSLRCTPGDFWLLEVSFAIDKRTWNPLPRVSCSSHNGSIQTCHKTALTHACRSDLESGFGFCGHWHWAGSYSPNPTLLLPVLLPVSCSRSPPVRSLLWKAWTWKAAHGKALKFPQALVQLQALYGYFTTVCTRGRNTCSTTTTVR